MTRKTRVEVPGNAMATQALIDRVLTKTGHAVHELNHLGIGMEDEGWLLKAIRFAPQGSAAGEWLAVITVQSPEGPLVSFHGGSTFADCIEGLRNRLKNGSLKWKVDEYAK